MDRTLRDIDALDRSVGDLLGQWSKLDVRDRGEMLDFLGEVRLIIRQMDCILETRVLTPADDERLGTSAEILVEVSEILLGLIVSAYSIH